ncbi:T9SS type B sorting domain-containing protein [uncultured Nonlabens sp.]|uniref:T9SS type B sorting domain-containing protein n=1 Tax=uncultured Nonlabens sp. TaxID=859306 RepID=UPI0026139977|nr:T9SS type B sorting domain-containing protein [uncultured Nonlabens sp.]
MTKKIPLLAVYTIALITLSFNFSNAQLQASNWYFGFNAGINFDPATGTVTPLTDGKVSTNEGCASISDENGQLLFYTDGRTVYDSTHNIMINGVGLRGNPSSTQSAIIIPKPQNQNIYYIFTVDLPFSGGSEGVHYYEVDMTGNRGLGEVVTNIANPPRLIDQAAEKLTAINHSVNDEILVTAMANASGFGVFNSFFTYTISANGVNPTPVVSTVASPTLERRGNLKISPDGRYMVSCNMGSGTFIYDYDQSSGAVSNERRLSFSGVNQAGYGVEFSPDGNLLYITASNDARGDEAANHSSTLYQYQLTNTNLANPIIFGTEIDTRQGYRSSLQLGIDGKIYRAISDSYDVGRPFLGVINNPNTVGIGCDYQHDAIRLAGRISTQGLPPFIQSFFALIQVENSCLGDGTTFEFQSDTSPDSVLWDFGDGNTSTQENPTHIYAAARIYNVTLSLTTGSNTRVYRKNVQIYESPIANPITNQIACDLGLDGMATFDLDNTATPEILGSQSDLTYTVRYFTNQRNADDNINPITTPYESSITNQSLIARIYNSNSPRCYQTLSFNLEIFDQPVSNTVEDLEECDDDFDGIFDFNLSEQTSLILGTQNSGDFNVSYHSSQNDADLGTNPLPNTYRNTSPFNETVFIRVVNNLSNRCADTSKFFELIVKPKPVALDFNAFQCDEDGTLDGKTIFNLDSFNNSISNNATGVTVTYYINQTDADNNTNALNSTGYTNLTPLETIVARVTNDTTGCFTTAMVNLSVSASDAQDTTLNTCDDDGIEDGFSEFDLTTATSNVLINAPADVTLNYYLSLNDALTEQNILPTAYTNTTANNQTIFARAESPDGNCFGISEVELIVRPLPVIELTETYEYCGNDPQALVINSGIVNGTATDYTYSWSTGETTESISVTNGGDYTVTVLNTYGCPKQRSVNVIISEPATINSIEVLNAGTNISGSATINTSGLGDYEYRISLEEPFQDSPVFNNISPGFYTAYVRDRNGCGTSTQDFSIVGYPRYFTPNNDGFHDYWQLIGVSTVFEPNSEIYIFDRYGKLIKQLSAQGPGWDGTYNGTPLPSNDYWFKATLMDGTTFSSHFTLKR